MIEFQGKSYISSKEWHEQVKPTDELRLTNRSIRAMETYETLVANRHILELQRGEADPENGSALQAPKMLLDAVAQKAIEHHFEETAGNALQSSKESAILGLTGIRMDLIAQDPQMVICLQMLSRQKEIENQVARVPALIDEAMRKIGGHAGYCTVLAYARLRRIRITASHASAIGKAASKACSELGYQIQKVPDARFGEVNAYPEEVLEAVFHEYEGNDK
jgi:hypothetical protein